MNSLGVIDNYRNFSRNLYDHTLLLTSNEIKIIAPHLLLLKLLGVKSKEWSDSTATEVFRDRKSNIRDLHKALKVFFNLSCVKIWRFELTYLHHLSIMVDHILNRLFLNAIIY